MLDDRNFNEYSIILRKKEKLNTFSMFIFSKDLNYGKPVSLKILIIRGVREKNLIKDNTILCCTSANYARNA